MNSHELLNELFENINGREDLPINPEKYVEKINDLINENQFYKLPFPIFLRIIKNVDYSSADNSYELLKTIFLKANLEYGKNAIFLLSSINFFKKKIEEFNSIFSLLTNSPKFINEFKHIMSYFIKNDDSEKTKQQILQNYQKETEQNEINEEIAAEVDTTDINLNNKENSETTEINGKEKEINQEVKTKIVKEEKAQTEEKENKSKFTISQEKPNIDTSIQQIQNKEEKSQKNAQCLNLIQVQNINENIPNEKESFISIIGDDSKETPKTHSKVDLISIGIDLGSNPTKIEKDDEDNETEQNEEKIVKDEDQISLNNEPFSKTMKELRISLQNKEVPVAAESIFYINNENKQNKVGFLIEIPIKDEQQSSICGLLTDKQAFNDDEISIGYSFTLTPILYPSKNYKITLTGNRFCFRDNFLGVTFIHLPNIEEYFEILKIETDRSYKSIFIINNHESYQKLSYNHVNLNLIWGFELYYSSSNPNISDMSFPLLSNEEKVIGIHKSTGDKGNSIGIHIKEIIYAIQVLYTNKNENPFNLRSSKTSLKTLSKEELQQLAKYGFAKVWNGDGSLFKTRSKMDVSSLWYYRTNHAWYWTPRNPDSIGMKPNWSQIGENIPIVVIGGKYDNMPPVPDNVERIKWLAQSKFQFL